MALPSDISARRQELARMAVNYQSSAIDETKQLPAIDHSLNHLNDMSLEIKKRQREDHDEQYAVLQLLKETGRRTGEAAVIMENSEVAQEALQKLNEGDNFDRAARLKKIEKCVDECKTLMADTEKYLEQVRNTEKPAPFTQSSVHNIPDEARINKVLSHMTYIAQNQRANMDRMERDIRLLEQRQRQSKKSDTKPQIIVERQLPIDPSQPSVPIHQIDVRHSDAAGKSHCKIADVSTASPLPRRSRKQQEPSRIEQLLEESIRLHELDLSRDDKLNKSGAMCVSVGTQSDPIPKEVIVAPKVEPKMLPPIKQEIISAPKTIPFVPTTLSLMPSDRELAASYLGESPERTADISRLTPQPPPKSTAAISPLATQTSPKETPKTPVTRSSSGESASSTASEAPKSPKEPAPIVESPSESPLRDLLKEDEPTKPIQESTPKANRDEKPKSSIFGGSPSLNNFSFNDKEAKPDEKSAAPAAVPTSSIFGAKPTDTNFSTPTTTTVSTEEKKKNPPPSLFSFKPAASQPQAGTSAADSAKPAPTPSTFSFKPAAENAVPATTTAIETKPVTFSFSQAAAAATAQPTSIFGNKAPDASAQSSSIFGNKPAQPTTTTSNSIPFSFASAATAAAQTADAPKPAATGSSIFGGFAAKNDTKAAADDGMMDDQGGGMFGSGFMSGLGCKPNTSDQAKPSIFSFKPSTVPAATTGSSIFGGGLSKPAATGGSIFGGGQQQQQPAATQGSSIFGGPKPGGSIFGSKPATGGSIFGGGAQQQPQQQQGGGLFGAKAPEQSAQPSSIFGGAKPQQATGGSLFGGGATTGSTFGAKPQFGGSPVFGGQKPFGQQGSAFGGGSGGFAAAAKEMAQKGQPSLFGNTAAASGSSIFGGANASSPQQPASSIFGGGNTSAPQQPSKTSFTSWR
ncbi:unnamed protein product, partial [Mesorhabditis spiculigera]